MKQKIRFLVFVLMAILSINQVWGASETKSYGWETGDDATLWTITDVTTTSGTGHSGSGYGNINVNNSYVQFKNKVKVTSFSFWLKRTSKNSNYNVYIETSPDGETWTAAYTYNMGDFGNGSYTQKSETFDGNNELYIRVHVYNTTAVRNIDDVSITYETTCVCSNAPSWTSNGTDAASDISSTGATLNMSALASQGSGNGCAVTDYGFVYGTGSSPALNDAGTAAASGYTKVSIGDSYDAAKLSKAITGLTAGTQYYYKAYAVNCNGKIEAGNIQNFYTQVTVSYDKNTTEAVTGDVPAATEIDYNGSHTISSNVLSRTGYDFLGWSTNPKATEAQTDPVKATGSAMTFYAIWKIKTYDVEWYVNGNLWGEKVSYNHGASLALPATTPTSSNCDGVKQFVGWTATADYSNATTAPSDLFTSASGTVTEAKKYYAVFANAALGTTYTQITALNALEAGGRYLIVGNSSSTYKALPVDDAETLTTVTPRSSKISNPAEELIWTLEGTARSWKIKSVSNGKYLQISGGNLTFETSTSLTFDASVSSSKFTFTSSATSGNKILSYYANGNKFNAFTSANNVYLYKADVAYTNYATECSAEPTVLVSKSELTGLGYIETQAVANSVKKTFVVNGANLSANVVVTVSGDDFEVCDTENGTYASSVSIAPTDGVVTNKTVYVRLKEGKTAGDYNGSVNITSTGAEKSVTLAGSVVAKTLNSIAIKTAPTKTTYTLGEYFDPTGLVITRTYNSGTEELTYAGNESEFTFSPDLSTAIAGTHDNVQITWGTKTISQSILKNCSVAWFVNGSELTSAATTVGYNTKVTALPTAPTSADCDDNKVFVGWTAAAIAGETGTKPTDLFTEASGAQNLTANTTYYAVFANASEGGEPTTVLSEDFSSITTGNNTSTSGSGTSYSPAQNSNFNTTVTACYQAGGAIRLGKSGSLKTKTLDLSAGEVTVSVDVKGWSNSETSFSVQVDEQTKQSATADSYMGATIESFSTKTFTFSKGNAQSKVTFSTDANTRVFIDNIVIKCGDGVVYSSYATTCCTKWTAPTLTYDYSDAIHVNEKVDATWGEGATHGTVRFESSDTEVLTVNEDGQITAVGAGRATITAYWENDADGYCNNSVTSNEVVVTNSFNIIYKDKDNADFTGTGWESTQPTTHTYGTATTLVEPTKDYYTFSGWFIASDCSGELLTELAAEGYTEDITLYAKWTATEYNITYNLDGGVNSANNPAKYTVENAEITFEDPSKTGHAFLGWYDAETDGNKVTSIVPAETHDAVALWAKWSVNSYELTWDLGAADASVKTAGTTAGSIAYNTALDAPVVERKGYRFDGWKREGAVVDFGAGVLMPADAATYVAQWVKVWTVDFQNNGESITGYPKTVDENAALGELPTGDGLESCSPTSTTFVGWSTAEIIVPGEKPADNTFATAETTVTDKLVYNAVWAHQEGGETTWVKVTAQSEIVDGGVYKLAGTDGNNGYYAAKVFGSNASTDNNVKGATATVSDSKLTADDAVELTLGAVTVEGTKYYTIHDGSYYWYAPSNSANQLKGNATIDNKGRSYWTITISGSKESSTLSIVNKQNGAAQDGIRGVIRYNYNSGSPIFSCYEDNTKQNAIELYKKEGGVTYSNYITKCTTATIYSIVADAPITGGSVAIVGNKTNALENDEIEVVANPDEGWQFKSWNILDSETADDLVGVNVMDNKFIMPAANVTVSATFEMIPVSEISLSFNTIDVEKNEMPALPTVSYLPTTILESQKGVIWTSEDEKTVGVEGGYIWAYNVGQATLTATSATNPSVTATLTVNVYEWNLATTTSYSVTSGTLDNLTDAMSFTASEWSVKANYVRSDDGTKTKKETVADWKAFIDETEITDGYQYQLSDNNKTLYIKVGDVVAASYELTITEIAKDRFVVNIFDVDGIAPNYTGTYDAPAVANQTAGNAVECKDHNIFVGWVLEEYKDNPTDEHIIKAGDQITANNDTYYAVWAEKKNVTEQKSAKIESFSPASGATNGAKGKFDDNVKYETAQGSGTSAPSVYSEALRMYRPSGSNTTGSLLTISAQNGYSISKITITMTGAASFDYYLNSSSTAAGSLSATSSALTQSIENLSCSSVLFKHTTKANTDIKSMSVEYEKMVLKDVDYITECVTRYELSFDVNGGSGENFQGVMLKEGAEYTLPTPTMLSKDKCDFTGWYAIGENDEHIHYDLDDPFTMPAKATTLYAEWTPWTLESISLTTKDVKTVFDEDEMYINENLSVTAHYADKNGDEQTKFVSGWVTDHDSYKLVAFGHDYTGVKAVTVSYEENGVEKTTEYNITIRKYTQMHFYVNGTYWKSTTTKTGTILLPEIPGADAMGDLNYFVGWSKSEVTSMEKPVLVSGDAAIEEGDIFYAVFGKTTGETTDKKVTITRTSIPNSNWASFAWVNWAQDGIAGEVDAYHQTGNIQMNNTNGSKTGALFSVTPLPGYIKSIKITKASGTDRNWSVYGGNTAFSEAAIGGTQIEEAKSVTTAGATWTVTTGDYRYFMCKVTGGSTNIASIEVTYADPEISIYSTKSIEMYTRDITNGQISTVCLPKAVEAGMFAGASFYEVNYLEKVNNDEPYKIHFNEVKSLEAGMPYLMVPEEGATEAIFYYSGEAYETASTTGIGQTKNGMIGRLENPDNSGYWMVTYAEPGDNYYMVYENRIRLCGAYNAIYNYRAYFDVSEMSDQPQAAPAGCRQISLTNINANPGYTTDVEDVNAKESVQKVLINGKFFIIRSGKMFDLNGHFVK